MNIENYHLIPNNASTRFEFMSIGSRGMINKVIEFQPSSIPSVFNLAFGDKFSNDNVFDDLAVSNNGDTQKVLGTVIAALNIFFDVHPNAIVYATGSTPARTRLYQIGINKFYEEAIKDFYLYGQIDDKLYMFEKGKNYDGFIVKRKIE